MESRQRCRLFHVRADTGRSCAPGQPWGDVLSGHGVRSACSLGVAWRCLQRREEAFAAKMSVQAPAELWQEPIVFCGNCRCVAPAGDRKDRGDSKTVLCRVHKVWTGMLNANDGGCLKWCEGSELARRRARASRQSKRQGRTGYALCLLTSDVR